MPKTKHYDHDGNFIAKIDSNNRGYEEIIGQHGLSEMNDSDEMLFDLCALSNLVFGGVKRHPPPPKKKPPNNNNKTEINNNST